jgi:hypothetical protein
MNLILLFISQIVFAQTELNFEIAGKPTIFYQYDEARLMSNKVCKPAANGNLCSEFEFLKKMKIPKSNAEISRGALGSVLCRELLNGIILMGVNPVSKAQNSFCKINDLIVDIGTINYYATK